MECLIDPSVIDLNLNTWGEKVMTENLEKVKLLARDPPRCESPQPSTYGSSQTQPRYFMQVASRRIAI